ncbi:DUF1971 domain-containing protein [Qipengyuania sp. GH25]|uniref:DUF1971 domain-containing protein n=1 Tax=Qipengyuania pacifica TaxID=2860199 RepID=A0ABS7JK77_9SPHN|nr:DUF1971 domain-containing protein [Qipengyuania aerophila]
MTSNKPYKVTPVFSEVTLPAALRNAHSTKAGVWGVIRVLEGRLDYVIEETGKLHLLDPHTPGLVLPQEAHRVEPVGAMKMRVEFHHAFPSDFAAAT